MNDDAHVIHSATQGGCGPFLFRAQVTIEYLLLLAVVATIVVAFLRDGNHGNKMEAVYNSSIGKISTMGAQ